MTATLTSCVFASLIATSVLVELQLEFDLWEATAMPRPVWQIGDPVELASGRPECCRSIDETATHAKRRKLPAAKTTSSLFPIRWLTRFTFSLARPRCSRLFGSTDQRPGRVGGAAEHCGPSAGSPISRAGGASHAWLVPF